MDHGNFTGQKDIDIKLNEMFAWDKNSVTRSDLQALILGKKISELRAIMMTRLEFGTAGLRGPMGPGFNAMNDLVVIQTSQGLATHILSTLNQGEPAQNRSVVVGYDGRYNSRRFAELTTNAFVAKGFTVYLYSKLCPTPFVPFAVTHFKCLAGIMITASHNPKEDNGYKVYWSNGAQIVSPIDKDIQHAIMEELVPWESAWETPVCDSPLVVDPLKTVMDIYYRQLERNCLNKDINAACPIRFTYTPMHGVGQVYMREGFRIAGFKEMYPVDKQMDPNPDFPTVRFPNPEEGKSALDLAIQTANERGSTIILANDPDADRLAVAEKQSNDEWKIFNGNELGALLGWWSLYLHRNGKDPVGLDKCVMIASTVSSKFLGSLAKVEGFTFIETLTGFKWMGTKAHQLQAQGVSVLFAFEEAIGFMMGTDVLDKDGISAGVRMAELVAFLATTGETLTSKLNQLYDTYGYHVSDNSYFICHDTERIGALFSSLRNGKDEGNTLEDYPGSILNGKFTVVSVRDLTTGFDSSQPDGRAILPTSRSSHMITFTFNNGLVVTLRTSGTEPKVKYYTELIATPEEKDYKKLGETLHEMVAAIVQEFLRPEEFGLLPKSD